MSDNFVVDEEEFDLQPRLLKTKNAKQQTYYVEYDRFTNSVIEITTTKKSGAGSIRNGVITVTENEIITKILSGTLHIGAVTVIFDKTTKKRSLSVIGRHSEHSEFDYVFATFSDDAAPIHLECDVIFKKIKIHVNYDKLREFLSDSNISEKELAKSNSHVKIFVSRRDDPTCLLDRIELNIFEICNSDGIERTCLWLPDDTDGLSNISFIFQNIDLPVTYSTSCGITDDDDNNDTDVELKPQLLYKQMGETLSLQSTMEDANNYKINDEITLYFFDHDDPTILYGYKRINRSELNNFSMLEISLKTDKKIKMNSDHFHIYIEDSDVSTYYGI